ncbi:MAG: fatty acyl-AMP ligase [Planctomycetaceae bacterium]|nr:fatty acyl-AMP ligase [Planctomycetaceae bacterium]
MSAPQKTGRATIPPTEASILEILDDRAESLPDRTVFTFLDEGEHEAAWLTYAGLQRRARAIAAELQQHTVVGDRVFLVYPFELEVIAALFACFSAGVIAVPTPPPRMELLEDGLAPLAALVKDCEPAVILSGGVVAEQLQALLSQRSEFSRCVFLNTDAIADERAADFAAVTIDRDTRAVLQYTSGSTGLPKGVMISHGNILHNSYVIQLALQHRTATPPPPATRWEAVCWLPYYHDMGLIADIIQPVFADGPSYRFSPLVLLQRPVRWLEAISRYRAHTSGGPNFAYDLCVRRISDDQKTSLDLSCWNVAAIGAEPISPHTIERFADAFACCGFRKEAFYPCYGLAEATLIVSGGDKQAAPVLRTFPAAELAFRASDAISPHAPETRPISTDVDGESVLVGCGHAWTDHEIVLVDPESCHESPEGAVGEIWFAGPSVAEGYWGRAAETRETFNAYLSESGRGPFLRTGDLGVIRDGELFICGRIKDLIVIRGRNHYPEDIEATVSRVHEAFPPSGSVALGCVIDGEERLVLLQEIDRRTRKLDLSELAREIRRRVAEQHQLQAHEILFLQKGALPKTTSGKVRRRDTQHRYLTGQLLQWAPKANTTES